MLWQLAKKIYIVLGAGITIFSLFSLYLLHAYGNQSLEVPEGYQ